MTRTVHDVMVRFDDATVHGPLDSKSQHAVHEVTVDGRSAVCKVAGRDDAVPLDAALLDLVGSETPAPVPDVLAAGDDHYVTAWVDGEQYDGEAPHEVRRRRLRATGRALARVHEALTFEAHGRLRVDDEDAPTADAVSLDVVGTWDEMLLDVGENWRGALPDRFAHLGDAVLAFLDEHRAAFRDRPATLVHGDPASYNLLFEGESLAAMLDWELAFAGAGEVDLARAEQLLFVGDPPPEPDGDLRAPLREGYESVRPRGPAFDGRHAAYRALLALNPLRSFDEWEHDVDDPSAWADHYESYVPNRLETARAELADVATEPEVER